MSDVTMIMPMAGRGSRFAKQGETLPKPLVDLAGTPFFIWATLGIRNALPDARLIYVVLQEHVDKHGLDARVREAFGDAEICVVPEVTTGALETALLGVDRAGPDTALLINDCDHAFAYSALPRACQALADGAAGFLTHFRSNNPHFSYAAYDAQDSLIETAEKRVISDRAIAGVYGFRDAATLRNAAERYRANCPYPEMFVSGVYNEIAAAGGLVRGFELDLHIPFGTPEEAAVARTRQAQLETLRT